MLYLFPDRVLVYESGKVGTVGYDQLHIAVTQSKFIEDRAPSNARVVDRTGRYVNKKGGPDRRFSNNSELPVCLYDEIHFGSPTGLNEIIQLSRCGIAESFSQAVTLLRKHLVEAAEQAKNKWATVEKTFFIGKNGADLGEISLTKIRQMLSSGELVPQDYFFLAARNEWLTIDQIPELGM